MTCSVHSPIMEAVGDVLCRHWMDEAECNSSVVFQYAMKASVCDRFRPRSVISLGVGSGYSLMAFHEVAPRADYLLFDDAKSLERIAHCKRAMLSLGMRARLVVVDLSELKSLPFADFAHVDWCVGYAKMLARLRLVSQCRGVLVENAGDNDVRRAVEQAAIEAGREVEYFDDGVQKGAILT